MDRVGWGGTVRAADVVAGDVLRPPYLNPRDLAMADHTTTKRTYSDVDNGASRTKCQDRLGDGWKETISTWVAIASTTGRRSRTVQLPPTVVSTKLRLARKERLGSPDWGFLTFNWEGTSRPYSARCPG